MVVGSLTVECDVVVLGSGPGGYVAAIRAAQLGKDVLVVEKDKKVGGVCLHVGCIPTKALITSSDYVNALKDLEMMGITAKDVNVDVSKMNSWKDGIIDKMEKGIRGLFNKYGIEVIEGKGTFKDKNTLAVSGQSDVNTITFKHAIVATGSSPIQIPGFEYDGNYVITSDEGISLNEIPKKLIIVGGGYIGTELGTVYGKLGTEVHILEGTEHLIPQIESDVVDVVAQSLEKFNVHVHYNSIAKKTQIENNQVQVEFEENGSHQTLVADKVMVVVGRRPNTKNIGFEEIGVELDEKGFVKVDGQLKSSVENIHAIGDISGQPMLAHKASREAKVAAEVVCGQPSAFDNKVVPAVVFNDPEIISVGLTSAQAQEQGKEVIEKKFPYAALARAHMFDRTKGFIKLVAEKESNIVLGVHAVGPHVSEIVAEATLAIEMGATIEDVALTIHPHPTISEGLSEVSDMVLGQAIHIYDPDKKKEE